MTATQPMLMERLPDLPGTWLFPLLNAVLITLTAALAAYLLARGLTLTLSLVDCLVLVPPVVLAVTLLGGWSAYPPIAPWWSRWPCLDRYGRLSARRAGLANRNADLVA